MTSLAAQSEFYLNSLVRLKCLLLASCSAVCQMQRAEEAGMPPQPDGHAEQQQGFDGSRHAQVITAGDPCHLPLCPVLT